MLQRLLMSGGGYHLWGEPYARSDVVRRLGDSLLPVSAEWPPDAYLAARDIERTDLTRTWVANLYPPLEDLVAAHRSFYTTLFTSSLPPSQRSRWGFKEVRLSIDYAIYLALVFPRARFVFLVRDPFAAYASYKAWRSWYDVWPAQQIRTPRAFGRMWRGLAKGYRDDGHRVDSVLVRYEDLASPVTANRLEDFLGVELDRSVVEERVRGRTTDEREALTRLERRMLRLGLGGVERELGYPEPDTRGADGP